MGEDSTGEERLRAEGRRSWEEEKKKTYGIGKRESGREGERREIIMCSSSSNSRRKRRWW